MAKFNTKKNKIISIILAIAIIMSTTAFSMNAFASSTKLFLNLKMTAVISGPDDLEWFYYTPDQSGMYSLLSYNVPTSEAYLFTKEYNQETGKKEYIQLAYSKSDPNYEQNEHNQGQFCLSYHLEAGVTYYYAVGWFLSQDRTSGTTSVMLRCDSYDENAIDRVEISCPVKPDVYLDGAWYRDSNGQLYFRYNIDKIVKNSTVTIYYSNGTSSKATGAESIDGYNLNYVDNQIQNHWYPKSDPNYNGNVFSVRVLDKVGTCNVEVVSSSRYLVKGVVENVVGEPIANAVVSYGSNELATTDSNGKFSFYMIGGQHNFEIKTDTAIKRTKTLVISTSAENNDFTKTPFVLFNCDYVKDGYINAKDYYYMVKNNIPKLEEYKNTINFTSENYKDLT